MSDEELPEDAPEHIRASIRSVNSSIDAYRLAENNLKGEAEEEGDEE